MKLADVEFTTPGKPLLYAVGPASRYDEWRKGQGLLLKWDKDARYVVVLFRRFYKLEEPADSPEKASKYTIEMRDERNELVRERNRIHWNKAKERAEIEAKIEKLPKLPKGWELTTFGLNQIVKPWVEYLDAKAAAEVAKAAADEARRLLTIAGQEKIDAINAKIKELFGLERETPPGFSYKRGFASHGEVRFTYDEFDTIVSRIRSNG